VVVERKMTAAARAMAAARRLRLSMLAMAASSFARWSTTSSVLATSLSDGAECCSYVCQMYGGSEHRFFMKVHGNQCRIH
jgi:hypothetical protein